MPDQVALVTRSEYDEVETIAVAEDMATAQAYADQWNLDNINNLSGRPAAAGWLVPFIAAGAR
jgi:hypothetical protein